MMRKSLRSIVIPLFFIFGMMVLQAISEQAQAQLTQFVVDIQRLGPIIEAIEGEPSEEQQAVQIQARVLCDAIFDFCTQYADDAQVIVFQRDVFDPFLTTCLKKSLVDVVRQVSPALLELGSVLFQAFAGVEVNRAQGGAAQQARRRRFTLHRGKR